MNMSYTLDDPQQQFERIKTLLTSIINEQKIAKIVVAVSGGIDSAVSLTLCTQIVGKDNIYPVFLPYLNQSIEDSKLISEFNQIPKQNWQEINIGSVVDQFIDQRKLGNKDRLRIGNVMARVRMIYLYDLAKQLGALVGGTENKSEKYLGYFTRFGDEASDIEPIVHLYKTQVTQLAQYLHIPIELILKAPSAELWSDQTDEDELGFSYQTADKVLKKMEQLSWLDSSIPSDFEKYIKDFSNLNIDPEIVIKVIKRVKNVEYKRRVPYKI